MPKAWYNRLVDMRTSRFGVSEHNSNWMQHVHVFQAPRALPPDEPHLVYLGQSVAVIPNVQSLVAGGNLCPRDQVPLVVVLIRVRPVTSKFIACRGRITR